MQARDAAILQTQADGAAKVVGRVKMATAIMAGKAAKLVQVCLGCLP